MKLLTNPYRGQINADLNTADAPSPSVNAAAPSDLISKCPTYASTPLVSADGLAKSLGIDAFYVKDERTRMGLGSFKALGAAYVIAHHAQSTDLSDRTYATASAGNHGLSVAAGARTFGAKSVVYIAETVPEAFAGRLTNEGADVRREGADYETSMAAAQKAARDNGWTLLSDSSWPGYVELPHRLMEGYLVMAAEIADQIPQPPTHIFLQAGVGGLAGAVAAYARHIWGDMPKIIVVEPEAAPALLESIRAGKPVHSAGPASNMGRLDCKEPSLIALKGLAHDADIFATLSEQEAAEATAKLPQYQLATTPSGSAGIVAALTNHPDLGLSNTSRVLTILTETE